MATEQPKGKGIQRKVKVSVPHDLDSTYANLALISNTASEIVLDYARLFPNPPQAKVHTRIVMTPMNAKLLHRALGEHLSKYEGQFGEIKLPPGGSLAEQLFRPPQAPDDGEE